MHLCLADLIDQGWHQRAALICWGCHHVYISLVCCAGRRKSRGTFTSWLDPEFYPQSACLEIFETKKSSKILKNPHRLEKSSPVACQLATTCATLMELNFEMNWKDIWVRPGAAWDRTLNIWTVTRRFYDFSSSKLPPSDSKVSWSSSFFIFLEKINLSTHAQHVLEASDFWWCLLKESFHGWQKLWFVLLSGGSCCDENDTIKAMDGDIWPNTWTVLASSPLMIWHTAVHQNRSTKVISAILFLMMSKTMVMMARWW